jgi:hypothetical protein
MGEFLSTPIRDKVSEDGENELVLFNNIDQIWGKWNARLEKKNGRFSYS